MYFCSGTQIFAESCIESFSGEEKEFLDTIIEVGAESGSLDYSDPHEKRTISTSEVTEVFEDFRENIGFEHEYTFNDFALDVATSLIKRTDDPRYANHHWRKSPDYQRMILWEYSVTQLLFFQSI